VIASRNPSRPSGRLIDSWKGGTDRDPRAVVAELTARAPSWLRDRQRDLTLPEKRFWFHLSDRTWFGAEVFRQVPIHLPDAGVACVMTFFVPALSARIEVCSLDFANPDLEALERQFLAIMAEDDPLREVGGIVTIRCPEEFVATRPHEVAKSVRWDLGLAPAAPANVATAQAPRSR
jgi:hypothetical protein